MGTSQPKPALQVFEGGLSGSAELQTDLVVYKFDSRGEISLPFGMNVNAHRKGVIEFYVRSVRFLKVSVPAGRRFIDGQELFEKAARESVGASRASSDEPMPLILSECLDREQARFIPKRLQGKIILFMECFLTDSAGKLHIRTLEFLKKEKKWVKGTIPVFGAAFYPELFVVARCKLHFKEKTVAPNYFDDLEGHPRK